MDKQGSQNRDGTEESLGSTRLSRGSVAITAKGCHALGPCKSHTSSHSDLTAACSRQRGRG